MIETIYDFVPAYVPISVSREVKISGYRLTRLVIQREFTTVPWRSIGFICIRTDMRREEMNLCKSTCGHHQIKCKSFGKFSCFGAI